MGYGLGFRKGVPSLECVWLHNLGRAVTSRLHDHKLFSSRGHSPTSSSEEKEVCEMRNRVKRENARGQEKYVCIVWGVPTKDFGSKYRGT